MPGIFEYLQCSSGIVRLDGRVTQFVEHFDYQHTNDVVILDYQKMHCTDPVSRKGYLLCARGGVEVPQLNGVCNQMERLAHSAFKYWLNALPEPPKLVRLAVFPVGVAQGLTLAGCSRQHCSMDFFRSGLIT